MTEDDSSTSTENKIQEQFAKKLDQSKETSLYQDPTHKCFIGNGNNSELFVFFFFFFSFIRESVLLESKVF